MDAWQPEYGSATEQAGVEASEVPTKIDVEVDVAAWAPVAAGPTAAPVVLFVDGVRRVDARVWISEADGTVRLGLAASYGAGVVCCDAGAKVAAVLATAVERRLVTGATAATAMDTRAGRFELVPCAGESAEELSLCLQQRMTDLEVVLAREAIEQRPDTLLVVDGPLRGGQGDGAVGSIKSQHRSYGPPIVQQTVARLSAGERTPVFMVGDRFPRWSWYVRLPGPVAHPLASVVRCELDAKTVPSEQAIARAGTVSATLPRYASSPAKDPRAPQNLYPIAGLERDLRHRLGDAEVVLRALRQAAVAAP